MLRTILCAICVTVATPAHADNSTPVTPHSSPAALAGARFYASSVVAEALRGTFDPFDHALGPPPSIYFPSAGAVVRDWGQEVTTHRLRAIRQDGQYELSLGDTDTGAFADARYFWRGLPNGQVETTLLGRSERMARLDRTYEQLRDEAGRRLALARLPSLAGCWVGGDERICLATDATAQLDGQRLAVRIFRARLECGETEILTVALLRDGELFRMLGLVAPGTLAEEETPTHAPVCLYPSFDYKSGGRTYRRARR